MQKHLLPIHFWVQPSRAHSRKTSLLESDQLEDAQFKLVTDSVSLVVEETPINQCDATDITLAKTSVVMRYFHNLVLRSKAPSLAAIARTYG